MLQNAVAEFAKAAERDPLVVSLDPQFANRWLPSRLGRLLADPVGANLEIRVEDRRADFVTDGVDLGVRYGAGVLGGSRGAAPVPRDPVPGLQPDAGRDLSDPPAGRPAGRAADPPRPSTLAAVVRSLRPAHPRAAGLLFEDSVMLLEAAAQGLGFALARSGLMEAYFETGRLVRPLKDDIASDLGFFVVWRADSRKLARIEALRDWLAAEAAESGARRKPPETYGHAAPQQNPCGGTAPVC